MFLSGTEEPPLLFSNSFFLVSALSMSLGTKSWREGGGGAGSFGRWIVWEMIMLWLH